MARRPSPASVRAFDQAVQMHRAALDRLLDKRALPGLKRLYDAAQADLARKLNRLIRTGRKETMTYMQLRQLLEQVKVAQAEIATQLSAGLVPVTREAQAEGVRQVARTMVDLEKKFTGATITLPIEEAATFEGLVQGRTPSLIRAVQTSFKRYGATVTGQIERELAVSLATGETPDDAIRRVEKVADIQWWRAERIVRTECLTGDTLVDAAVVKAAFRRWYEGPIVELVTASGRKLTATPNHPMLTRRGWIGAGSLNDSDDLISHLGAQYARAPCDQHIATRPAPIGEIFDAIQAIGVREGRRTAEPDFHGDGRDGYVDVAIPDGLLAVGCFAPLAQPLCQDVFTPTDWRTTLFCARCMYLRAGHESVHFCQGASRHASNSEASMNDMRADAVLSTQCVDSRTLQISLTDIFYGNVGEPSWMRAAAIIESVTRLRQTARGVRGADNSLNPSNRAPQPLSNLLRGEPSPVQFERLVSVRIRQFRGHVFNLSTADGYYAVNGVYTGNCAFAFNAAHADATTALGEDFDDVYQRWCEYVDDATGRPLDDRVAPDSLALHGQVVKPGDQFVMPPDERVSAKLWGKRYTHGPNRPNDRSVTMPWRPHWGTPAWIWRNGKKEQLKIEKKTVAELRAELARLASTTE